MLSADGSYVHFFWHLSNLDTLLQPFLFGLCCLVCRWVHEEHRSLYTSGDSQFRVFGSKYSSRCWIDESWKGEDCSYPWHSKGSELLGYRLLWESDKELLTCLDPNNFLKHNFINPQGSQLTPISLLFAVSIAPMILEYNDLLIFDLLLYCTKNLCIRNEWMSNNRLMFASKEQNLDQSSSMQVHYSTQPACQCHNQSCSWTRDHSTDQWYILFHTFPNLYCVPESWTTANQSSSPTVAGSLSLVCSNTREPGYTIMNH